MTTISDRIKKIAQTNDGAGVLEMLGNGLEPNFKSGWPLRLAARCGSYSVVRAFIQWGADPHLPSESGASALQLAVYSGMNWEEGLWEFLLACCDSSQLADGAAVAIVFKQLAALQKIIETGRCNINVSTTLTGFDVTGRTVESLAKAYNLNQTLQELLTFRGRKSRQCLSPALLNPIMGPARQGRGGGASPQSRTLSPSVAEFFEKSRRSVAVSAALSPHPHRSPTQHLDSASPLLFRSPTSTMLQ